MNLDPKPMDLNFLAYSLELEPTTMKFFKKSRIEPNISTKI
jgi:hypothetical protein